MTPCPFLSLRGTCSRDKAKDNHIWREPLYEPHRRRICAICGRRKRRTR